MRWPWQKKPDLETERKLMIEQLERDPDLTILNGTASMVYFAGRDQGMSVPEALEHAQQWEKNHPGHTNTMREHEEW